MCIRDSDRHVQVYTEWGTRQVAQLKKDTAVRLRGGVKSPILTQAAKGDTLELSLIHIWEPGPSVDVGGFVSCPVSAADTGVETRESTTIRIRCSA